MSMRSVRSRAATLDGQAHVGRCAVQPALAARRVADRAELRGDDDLVGARLGQRLAEEFLVRTAVHLRRVEEGDAAVEGAEDRARPVRVVLARAGVEGADAHQAETDAADLDGRGGSQSGGLHESEISLS
jgi:hypothetical protein